MKRTLSLILLLGALIGLFGQQVAYAAGAHNVAATPSASQMDADCMAMLEKQPQPAQKPCKGLTLDCIAAMGCVVPIVLCGAEEALASLQLFSLQAFWPATAILAGTALAPDPDPPTILG